LETAITVPSGAFIRNRKCDSASTNSSNIPAMGVLPVGPPNGIVAAGSRRRAIASLPAGLVGDFAI
jgi:hypothetical protein